MKPLFVRELSSPERQALQAGLRSSDGFKVRRCPILLASARGDTTTVIAQAVGCSPQAVRNVLRAFERRGLAVVTLQSRRPNTAAKLLAAERSQRLKASSDERQIVDLQLDALLAAGVDERHLHQDRVSGGRADRAGLKPASPGGVYRLAVGD